VFDLWHKGRLHFCECTLKPRQKLVAFDGDELLFNDSGTGYRHLIASVEYEGEVTWVIIDVK
jgi:hypothetical protein